MPKLGDFGLSIEIEENDEDNPQAYQGRGSQGFQAPEQFVGWQEQEGVDWLIGAHTNVWAIGATVISLMNLDVYPDSYAPEKRHEPKIADEGFYSSTLNTLVSSCVRWDPEDRITLPELRSRIDRHIGPIRNQGAQDQSAGQLLFSRDEHVVHKALARDSGAMSYEVGDDSGGVVL